MARPAISLKARALRYLSAREHSRLELSRKLRRYAQESDNINQVLDQLEAAKLLSQERFCDALINRRAQRFGNSRIFAELQSHGLGREIVDAVKEDLVKGEAARASEVWERKFGSTGAQPADRTKQMRFMQQRGFSHRAISAAMKGKVVMNEDSESD